ncbi:unnamed protein product [Spirodela intermedia]|uniref:Uncharacterized protein n=1 Tax=Spirodela intermedia TaxID=51605 RepID=A0A7I8K1W6_SPIIN|nr:unnamed protein product [Spirodela intermedia]
MLSRAFRGGREKSAAAVASVPPQQQRGRTLGEMMREKDDELALFLEMRKRDKERQNTLLLSNNAAQDLVDPPPLPPPGSKLGGSPLFKIASSASFGGRTGPDDFLNSDSNKNDYDWLLTPPGTPLFPFLDKETQRSPVDLAGASKSQPAALKSRLANPREPSSAKDSLVSRQQAASSGGGETHRTPLSGPGGPAAPTGLPALPVTSKSLRSSTPTSRASSVPSKPATAAPSRSATPAAARASTPTSRPSVVTPSRVSSRSATPTRRPFTPSAVTSASAPPARSSSTTRAASATTKSSAPSRGTSPTVKSRGAWKPSEMPGFSACAPPNLRTSLPERPSSASRGRPGAPTSRTSSAQAGANSRATRLQSSSPSRGRAPNGVTAHGRTSAPAPAVNRSPSTSSDSVSPVVIGSKMVERVVNLRRLAPPKQDGPRSHHPSANGRSASSPESSGFGRTLSKKSLDMAMRHMDIRRSIRGNLRPLMTSVPASSMYSVRTGPARSRTASTADSPLATRSTASSEQSVSNNIALCLNVGELDYDISSDRALSSPAGR